MLQPKHILTLVVLSSSFMSCVGEQRERPSPLRSDSTTFNSGIVKIEYSSPAVNEREIWGELIPYGRMWRTGANDASYISTSIPIKVNGVALDSGAYAIFTIPDEDRWEVILNEKWNQWGTYQYDSTLNVAQFVVKPYKTKEFSERMKFYFENDSLKFQWENLGFSLGLEVP